MNHFIMRELDPFEVETIVRRVTGKRVYVLRLILWPDCQEFITIKFREDWFRISGHPA